MMKINLKIVNSENLKRYQDEFEAFSRTVSDAVRQLRIAQRFHVSSDFADFAGISPATAQRLENDLTSGGVNLGTLFAVAFACDKTLRIEFKDAAAGGSGEDDDDDMSYLD